MESVTTIASLIVMAIAFGLNSIPLQERIGQIVMIGKSYWRTVFDVMLLMLNNLLPDVTIVWISLLSAVPKLWMLRSSEEKKEVNSSVLPTPNTSRPRPIVTHR